jgi:hypothetical protein
MAEKWPLKELVEVEWSDAITHGAWDSRDAHIKAARTRPLRTVGYLVQKNRTSVTVAQSMSSVTQHIADTMTIPRGEVRKIRHLGKVK